MNENRKKNIQVHFYIDNITNKILNDKLKSDKLSIQDFFTNKIKAPVKYISTEYRLKMQRINRELNTTGKKINNIGARIINENIYESDVTSIQNLIDVVIDLQNKLDKNIEQYFNKKDE